MAAIARAHSRGSWLWAVLAAAPPSAIEAMYLTTGPGFQSSRSRFVAAFLALLVLTPLGGALLSSGDARFASTTAALAGSVALGIAAGFSFGMFLLIAAVPASVALAQQWRDVPGRKAPIIFATAAVATVAVFGLGLALTGQ